MEVMKNLELELQKYLRLRKIFSVFEFVCLAALFSVFLYSGGNKVTEIFGCVATVLIVHESFLLVRRNVIKSTIKDKVLLTKRDLEFYSDMKLECEKIKNEFLTQGSKKFISDECKQLVWKEEMGIGWLSIKINEFEKKCDEAKQIMENLESIKKRLVIF
jgi:hypothetical protein